MALKMSKIDVELTGVADLVFDRFIDHSKEDRPPAQKLYLTEGNQLVFPSGNIRAFLSADDKNGVIKAVEKRSSGDFLRMVPGFTSFRPGLIPILSEGKPIVFSDFSEGSQFYIVLESTKTKATNSPNKIKQEAKPRPALKLPWELCFTVSVVENDKVTPDKLRSWFDVGGLQIGLGNCRPQHGRFLVTRWDVS